MNRITIVVIFMSFILLSCNSNTKQLQEEEEDKQEDIVIKHEIESVKIENLLRDSLELADNVEVVMSYLELPKATTLPAHYHPGEEFVYMLQGSGELSLKDKSKINVNTGDVVKIPLKHVHSFSTINEGAKAIVFRVHEKGQPDRILVDHD